MAKKKVVVKKDQPPTPAERALAERLFVKLYDPARGKTTEHIATEATEAAKVFYAVCLSSKE